MTVRSVSLEVRPSPCPRTWRGFGQGSARFVTVTPFMVFTTGGVEATSPASTARGTRLMSLLTGMFEWNPVPWLVTGSAKPRVAFRCFVTHLPIDSPSMRILWARLEAGLNKKVEMTLSASMRVGQRPLRLICVFFPGSCSMRGGLGTFAGQPLNLGLLISD